MKNLNISFQGLQFKHSRHIQMHDNQEQKSGLIDFHRETKKEAGGGGIVKFH